MSKILIVEDEVAIAELEKDYLELSGFEVEVVHQGDVGLLRALKEEFDLIILDLLLILVDLHPTNSMRFPCESYSRKQILHISFSHPWK